MTASCCLTVIRASLWATVGVYVFFAGLWVSLWTFVDIYGRLWQKSKGSKHLEASCQQCRGHPLLQHHPEQREGWGTLPARQVHVLCAREMLGLHTPGFVLRLPWPAFKTPSIGGMAQAGVMKWTPKASSLKILEQMVSRCLKFANKSRILSRQNWNPIELLFWRDLARAIRRKRPLWWPLEKLASLRTLPVAWTKALPVAFGVSELSWMFWLTVFWISYHAHIQTHI